MGPVQKTQTTSEWSPKATGNGPKELDQADSYWICTENGHRKHFGTPGISCSLVAQSFPRIPQAVVMNDGQKTETPNLLTELQVQLEQIMTDLNREKHGTKVDGLIVNRDIVPLTDFFTRLQGNKHLIPDPIHTTLWEQGQLLIQFANAPDAASANQVGNRYVKLREKFHHQFQEAYQRPASPAPPSLRLHPGRDSVK
jgi:hypothetical protein